MADVSVPTADRLRRIRDRHFDCYFELADAAKQATEEGADWFDLLDAEMANIRSALEWGLATARPETAVFAASLLWYWRRSRRYAEARHVLDHALLHPDLPDAARVDAFSAAGALAFDQIDHESARVRYEASRRLAVSAGDLRRQALAAAAKGWPCYHLHLTEEALAAFNEALELAQSLSLAERANALRGLAWTKFRLGDEDAARKLHREARTLLEEADDSDLNAHYVVEGNFLVQVGRAAEAFALAEKAMARARAGAGHLIFALVAKERAARALGDQELLRRVVDEGIQLTQAAGQLFVDHPYGQIRPMTTWEAHFQSRLVDHALAHGDLDTARAALARALRLFEGLDNLNPREADVRAGLAAQQARLAEESGA